MAGTDLSQLSIAQLVDLTGKRAIVTGAGRGVGKAIAARLVEAGATVAFVDIDKDLAHAACTEVTNGQGESLAHVIDVGDRPAVKAGIREIAERWGGLDILINNAGMCPTALAHEHPDELWDRVIDVNLKGAYDCSRASAPYLFASKGVIVNILSTEAFKAMVAGVSGYVTSKFALRGLTSALALEWGPMGVRVLGVAPFLTDTPGLREMLEDLDTTGAMIEQANAMVPMRRLGQPDDVARIVLFACSGLGSWMTGSTLLADGGYMTL